MKLKRLKDSAAYGYAQFGSMWKRGEARTCSFQMTGADGGKIPVQSRIAAYWQDGSIKWAAHTADSKSMGAAVEISPGTESCDERKECEKQDGGKSVMQENDDGWQLQLKNMSVWIPKSGMSLFSNLIIDGELRAQKAYLKLILERRLHTKSTDTQIQYQGKGVVTEAILEDAGPLMWSFCLKGIHRLRETGEEKIPFIVRFRLYYDTNRIDIQHTFLYDGDENTDFLKGTGIVLCCPVKGDTFDRHVRFGTDFGSFHEAASMMLVWDHKHPGEIYESQISGRALGTGQAIPPEDIGRLRDVAKNCPVWDCFQLYQDSDMHFGIRKKTMEAECCFLTALHGKRAKGTMAFGGTNGSVMVGLRDFWQKYPSGLELNHFSSDMAEAVIWIYTPAAEAYDYRHYDKRAYAETYYEGFSDFGATPYGIANTNDCSVEFCKKLLPEIIPSEEELERFGNSVANPPRYFGEPQYYHDLRAFGYWSLPVKRTQAECWLEEQLEKAVDFYRNEVEVRHWYGIYDYGDVMHTYDCFRHVWRYDIGGYAWQNTELMPTMWLWLSFLRTGRGDILKMAEAMSRHASDVDTYHSGELKGLGSRHGVRHWGCPCKEIRIGMAGHYRYHYYLLCDRRMEDVFEDTKDADYSLLAVDPLRYVYDRSGMTLSTHARSAPDWAAMVSNWMTQWERTLDERYLQKIRTGMEDIKAAPLGLVSGPDFEYEPSTGHLRYIGESATGGTHLQVALGAPQIWMELADLLEDEQWSMLLAEYGRFYYLTPQEKKQESKGLIGERAFLYPIMAAAMAAYGAKVLSDEALALKTVKYIFRALIAGEEQEGFAPKLRTDCGNSHVLKEIPWISTNFTSQWCLNVIVALSFIRDAVPETVDAVRKLLAGFPEEGLFRNC